MAAAPCTIASDGYSSQKKRGKRPPPDAPNSNSVPEPPSKKAKADTPMCEFGVAGLSALLISRVAAQYEKEVKSYAGRSLKDNGIGVRPLVK